jgi:hypothetical protein
MRTALQWERDGAERAEQHQFLSVGYGRDHADKGMMGSVERVRSPGYGRQGGRCAGTVSLNIIGAFAGGALVMIGEMPSYQQWLLRYSSLMQLSYQMQMQHSVPVKKKKTPISHQNIR